MAGANPEDVTRMEEKFRRYMLVYGGALLQDEDFAARFFALDQSRFVAAYLDSKGVPNVNALRPMLQELSLLGVTQALPLLGDYAGELETTLAKVQAELEAHGVALPRGGGRPAPRARTLN